MSASPLTIVEIRGQHAMTTSLAVADGCDLTHQAVIKLVRRYLTDFQELGEVGFEIRPFETAGGTQYREIAILNEDQATYLITLFRNKPIVRRFKLTLVKAFRKALNEISRLYADPPRRDLLAAKRAAHHPMMDALIEAREEVGKETDSRHFMCENRLCNFVVTGTFAKVDESALSNEEAWLLGQVRERNRALLLAGLDYETRKSRLQGFAVRLRTRRLECAA